MRVYLMMFPSALFSAEVVEHLAIAGNFDLVGVGEVPPKKRGRKSAWLREQVHYWGAIGSFWIAAASLARKVPALLRLPRALRMRSSVAAACQALEIPFRTVEDVNDPAFVDFIRAQRIDVIVSFQQRIFGKALLGAPRVACLNVHTGLLPGYRGSKPVFWMHSRKEPELGVTIHTMGEEIDTGRVVTQRRWKRRPASSVLENQFWSYRCAAHAIVEAVETLGACAFNDLPEIPCSSPYFQPPTRAERDLAVCGGLRLV